MKDLLLQNEKLVWAKEEKVLILVAIHASLPAITEKAALLQTAGFPDLDAAIITGQPQAHQRNLEPPLRVTP